MSKQLLEINKFQQGTITTPDTSDTPEQSSTYSLNLDCVNKDGALQGAPVNSTVTSKKNSSGGVTATIDFDKCKVIKTIKDDGTTKEDVVAWDDGDNKLRFLDNAAATNPILDPSGTPFYEDGVQFNPTALLDVAMEVNNKEVHVGLGRNNRPKWAGYTNHKGITYGAGRLIVEDAEVKYPSSIPYMYKVVRAGNDGYVYGIELGGTKIWKIDGTNGTKHSTSTEGTFNNLRSICTDGSGNLFVLDKSGNGKVIKVATSDLSTPTITYTLPNTYPGPSGTQYSDIEYTSTNTIQWIAAHYDSRSGSASSSSQFLWKFTAGGSSATVSLTNMMPRMGGGSDDTIGTWVSTVDGNANGTVDSDEFVPTTNSIKETFPRSLLKHGGDNAAIYWLARYQNSGDDGSADFEMRWLNRDHADMSGSENFDKVASVSQCRTLVLHRIKNDHSCDTNNAGNTDFVPMYNVYHPNGANGSITAPGTSTATFSAINIDSIGIDNTNGEIYLTIGSVLQKLSGDIDTSWTSAETSGNYNKYSLVSENAVGPTTETNYSMTPTGQTARTGVSMNFGYVPSSAAVGSAYSADSTNMVVLRQTGTAGFDKISKTFANNTALTYFNDHSVIGMVITNESSTTSELQSGYSYFYKISMMYDGYQESTLSGETVLDANSNTENNTIALTVNDKTQISDRVSAIKIYRAEHTSSTATAPASVYRLVKTLTMASGWAESGDVGMTQTMTDTGFKGASYEAESGLPETMEGTLPNYSLSTQLNNQHYIGKCKHEGFVDDASSYIFVSKVGKFDVFDWVVDFIKLPTIPTALTSFAGRVFAFDENNTYRIRGGNDLYIEDIFEGVGCLNDDAIVSTDFGLFFAGNNNIYQHNGQSAEPIGEPIVRGSTYSWQNRDTSYHTRAIYDAVRRSVYFTFKSGSNFYAWAWNIPRKRWDLLSIGDTADDTQPKGFFLLNNNSINLSNGTSIIKYLGGSNKRVWEWHSKDLSMGNDTQLKKIKEIIVPSDLKVAFKTDGTAPTAYADLSNTNATEGVESTDNGLTIVEKKQTKRVVVNSKIKTIRIGLKPTQATKGSTIDECGAVSLLFKTKRTPR